MPTYVYKSEDGDTIEIKMTWKEAKEKPTLEKNGKLFRRKIQPFTPQFIGSGFHCNDYSK